MSPYLGQRPCIRCEHFHERSCRHEQARDFGGKLKGMRGYMNPQPIWPPKEDNDTCGWWRPSVTPKASKGPAP